MGVAVGQQREADDFRGALGNGLRAAVAVYVRSGQSRDRRNWH
jgi:hypothetical protein